MFRRDFIKKAGTLALGAPLMWQADRLFAAAPDSSPWGFERADFGEGFKWGVATAAYQIEGAWDQDGKGPSIWDDFVHRRPGKIKTRENGDVSCDFYRRYKDDIALIKAMNLGVFRFSTAWSRLLPEGIGTKNQQGLDFYDRVVDTCLEAGVEPWITLYHWDLPLALEKKGGWANREIVNWFAEYADLVTRTYGDRVKNWMVLNEPAAYTALGYLAGMHAPGLMAPKKFLAAVHHATLCTSEGARAVRANAPGARVGSSFSCAKVYAKDTLPQTLEAAHRLDVMLNRLFLEPVLGMGYPTEKFEFLQGIESFVRPGDEAKMAVDLDFVGLQNYTRAVAKYSLLPFVWFRDIPAKKRGVAPENTTDMGWEVYPEGIYEMLRQFAAYPNIPPIIVTENGAAFPDAVENGAVRDTRRVEYFQRYLAQVLRAKRDGVDVRGYFVWTLMDNFEWAEGYRPRFGLVHVDFATQQRTVKDSGKWFRDFLA
jgi:beta-glucosidase